MENHLPNSRFVRAVIENFNRQIAQLFLAALHLQHQNNLRFERDEREFQRRIQELENQFRGAHMAFVRAQRTAIDRRVQPLQDRIGALENANAELQEQIQRVQEQAEREIARQVQEAARHLQGRLQEALRGFRETQGRAGDRIQRLEEVNRELQRQMHNVREEANGAIIAFQQDFLARLRRLDGRVVQLEQLPERVRNLEDRIAEIDENLINVADDVESLEESLDGDAQAIRQQIVQLQQGQALLGLSDAQMRFELNMLWVILASLMQNHVPPRPRQGGAQVELIEEPDNIRLPQENFNFISAFPIPLHPQPQIEAAPNNNDDGDSDDDDDVNPISPMYVEPIPGNNRRPDPPPEQGNPPQEYPLLSIPRGLGPLGNPFFQFELWQEFRRSIPRYPIGLNPYLLQPYLRNLRLRSNPLIQNNNQSGVRLQHRAVRQQQARPNSWLDGAISGVKLFFKALSKKKG